jgi:rod shape determining protein RodA
MRKSHVGPGFARPHRRTNFSGFSGLAPLSGLRPVRPHDGFGALRTRPLARSLARIGSLRQLDWILLSAVLGLGVTGLLLVSSATRVALLQEGADPLTYLKKQLLNLVIGLILMLTVGLLEHRNLREYSPLAYIAALVCLLAVLSPLGTSVNGARAWISLPAGFQVEPSEYAKLGLILMTARVLGDVPTADRRPRLRDVALALACAAPVISLVAAEPALGVTVLLMILLAGLIVLSGTWLRWLALLGAAVAGVALGAWWLHLLKPYQLQRLTAFVNPGADPTGAGYSVAQAKIAIGSGGLLGQGLLHGQLVAGNFVPEQHTDFIFTVAGEELGFVGAVIIIGLVGVVVVRALLIAARADDQFGTLVAGGIAIWFAVQSFVNIGMTIGIVPVTGLPLPFVSYGGSAMIADMLAVGALQSIHRRQARFRSAGPP